MARPFRIRPCAQKGYAQLRNINELDLKAGLLGSGGVGFAECTAKTLTGIRVPLNDGNALDHDRTCVGRVQGRQFDLAQDVAGLQHPTRRTTHLGSGDLARLIRTGCNLPIIMTEGDTIERLAGREFSTEHYVVK